MFFKKYFFAAGMSLLLAACGGGGGGGGDDSVDVSIYTAAATLQAQTFEGLDYAATIHVTFKGNFADLNGKTVYVLSEVSGLAMQGSPEIAVAAGSEPFADVGLHPAADENLPAGVYEGTAKIYACLDTQCNRQLRNSPLTVPYKVTVHAGLSLALSTVDREVPFGTKPQSQRIPVQLPDGVLEWSVTDFNQSSGDFSVSKAADGSANIDVTFAKSAPGRWSESFMVSASAPSVDGSDRTEGFQKYFTVNYTVTESTAPPIAFDPESASYSFSQGSPDQGYEQFAMVAANGTYERVGSVYLAAPAAANGNPKVNDWLLPSQGTSNQYFVVPCDVTGNQAPICLPAGYYSAAIRFRHTSPSGVVTDVDYPISMTIRP